MTEHDHEIFGDEIRPFFGEKPSVIGENMEPVVQHPGPRRGSYEEIRQWRIAEGICPMAACGTPLDEEACPRCGWSLLEEKLRARIETPEDQDDYLPTLPGALLLDEYGPANLEPDE